VRAGNLVFCSGQLSLDPASGELRGDTFAEQARGCLDNLGAVAAAAGATLEDAVRITIYLTDMSAFAEVNEVYAGYFGESPPARAAIGVASLPKGGPGRDGRRARARVVSSAAGIAGPTAADIAAARPAVATIARHTPVLSTRTISERIGGRLMLKAENLQRTGSFKVRGASAKLAALGEEGCASGVVAASAGNHAQAVAAAAAALGVRCEVHVPGDAPIAKVEATRSHGATVHVGGDSVSDCIEVAPSSGRRRRSWPFVHPFDDVDIVAGQGTLGLELLEGRSRPRAGPRPARRRRLLSGTAIAIKSAA
jgi:reactive intermediate/imine deaminase